MCAIVPGDMLLLLLKELLMGRLREELETKGTELAPRNHTTSRLSLSDQDTVHLASSSPLSNSGHEPGSVIWRRSQSCLQAWTTEGRVEARGTDQLNRRWTGYWGWSDMSWFSSSSMGKVLGQQSRAWVLVLALTAM